jgi:thiosulfate/3-mercaptopyruvate sulfurtransferase
VDASTGLFKPADAMRHLLAVKGITPDKEIVSYCQGGGRAAHGVLALKLLGYGRVRNFDGSYGAYSASTAPVER